MHTRARAHTHMHTHTHTSLYTYTCILTQAQAGRARAPALRPVRIRGGGVHILKSTLDLTLHYTSISTPSLPDFLKFLTFEIVSGH